MTLNELIEATEASYSWDRYTEAGWKGSIKFLKAQGHTDHQVIELMKSKITRWAADHASKYDGVNSADFKRFYNDCKSTVDHVLKEIVQQA